MTVLLAVSGTFYLQDNYSHPELAFLLSTAQALPVLIARFRPLTAWSVALVASAVVPFVIAPNHLNQPWPWTPAALIAYLLVQLAVSNRWPRWVSISTWTAVVFVSYLVVLARPSTSTDATQMVIMLAAFAAITLAVGDSLRVRRQAQARIIEHERLSAEERGRRQLLEERTRIARELHDVVAHHMSVIAVQASSASARIGELPDAARAEFDSIGAGARESLAEMRRLLNVLRSDDGGIEKAPQPSLDRIDQLVEATRRAGTPVLVTVRNLPRQLPDAVGVSTYRIVQEALSNVVRHAPEAATEVKVVGETDQLRLRVSNAPSPHRSTPLEPDAGAATAVRVGHGLTGMRERVDMLGGTMIVGPRSDGGFRVEVTLPVERSGESDVDGRDRGNG